MADIAVTQASVRPLPGAVVRGGYLGEAAGLGDWVAIKNDGKYWKADANAPVVPAVGVIVAVGSEGASSGVANDRVSILFGGPLAGFTGTAGTLCYLSDTAAKMADAIPAGNQQTLGIFLESNVFYANVDLKEAL